MNQILAVTGMTGVGKDFLVERANRAHRLPTTNLGTLIGKKLGADRDLMMDTTDPAHIRAAQMSAYREVIKIQPHIVTCHAVRKHAQGYNYDLEMERVFNPRCYAFVTAPPEVIAKRVAQRNERGERKSFELSIDEIAHVQETKLRAMEELTDMLGCKLLVINNTDEAVSDNTQLLAEQISQLRL